MQKGLQGTGDTLRSGVGRQRRRFTLDRMLRCVSPGPASGHAVKGAGPGIADQGACEVKGAVVWGLTERLHVTS